MIDEILNVLRYKKNVILQGAPGVGKTFVTAELALRICGVSVDFSDHKAVMSRYEELQKSRQIGFVTFHQSMDYEDFVEGIKPEITENGNVSYKVKDGIFKEICKKEIYGSKNSGKIENVSHKISKDEIKEILIKWQKERKALKLVSGKNEFFIANFNDGNNLFDEINTINVYVPSNKETTNNIKVKASELEIILQDDSIKKSIDVTNALNRTVKTGKQEDSYLFALYKEIKKHISETKLKQAELNKVLIIDEINRGNVSKIFGELITLLESDKRLGGEHPLRVTLPYSKKDFGIPNNLYIIGTMNTTDRSVGSIDYAVRRRFAFVTLPADESVLDNYPKGKEVFEAVSKFIKDNNSNDIDFDDLMVGHSYFMAKNEDDKEDEKQLKLKLKYEIIPLLEEYNKDGLFKPQTKIPKFKDDIDEYIKDLKGANKENN